MTESQAHYSTSVLQKQVEKPQTQTERIIDHWECEEAWSQADFLADRYLEASYVNPSKAESFRQQMFAANERADQLQHLFNAQRDCNPGVAL